MLKNRPRDDFIPFFFCAAADADDGNVWWYDCICETLNALDILDKLVPVWPINVGPWCNESWLLWREDNGDGGVENPLAPLYYKPKPTATTNI